MAEVAKDMAKRKGSGSAKELYEFIKKVRLVTYEVVDRSRRV